LQRQPNFRPVRLPVYMHTPPEHIAGAASPGGHLFPHEAQLLTSFCRLTQLLLQLVKPLLHAIAQVPLAQTAVPVPAAGELHTAQALPQCMGSWLESTQAPPQTMSGDAQLATHVVPLHIWPATQAVPELPPSAPHPAVAPQFVTLVVGSMHVPAQLISLPGHDTWQLPVLHTFPLLHDVPAKPPVTPHPAVAPQ
jgi:hypothetical protein